MTAISFIELLTASDSDLVRMFYKIQSDPKDDFIIRINKVAAQLGLNHTQLVCALGFNRHIRDLTDILSVIGFKSYKLLKYRTNELFRTDTYRQLSIDNVIDVYSEHLEDPDIYQEIRDLLHQRLNNIEAKITETDDPALMIPYRMEIHTLYTTGLADQAFAEARLANTDGRFRIIANEVKIISDAGVLPPSNMFFMDTLMPEEKQLLIENKQIPRSMIENRLKNARISPEERDLLENYI